MDESTYRQAIFLSHPARIVSTMKLITTENTNKQTSGDTNLDRGDTADAVFADPVRYLAGFGIDAQLVSVTNVQAPKAA